MVRSVTTHSPSRNLWRATLAVLGWAIFAVVVLYSAVMVLVLIAQLDTLRSNTGVDLVLPASAPLPDGIGDGTAELVEGSTSQVSVIAANLSDSTRWLLALGAMLTSGANIALAAFAGFSIYSLNRRRLFGRRQTFIVALVAAGYAMAATVGVMISALGHWSAASELTSSPELVPFALRWTDYAVDPGGIFLIAIIASAFTVGARLRRDTAGLV